MFSSLYCSIHHYLLRLYQIQRQSRTFLCKYLLIFYQISVFSEIVCWNTGCGAFGRHLHRCCTRRLRERAPDSRILRRKLREPIPRSRIFRRKLREPTAHSRIFRRKLREPTRHSRILRQKLREPTAQSRIFRQKTRTRHRFSFLISGFYTNSFYSDDFPRFSLY